MNWGSSTWGREGEEGGGDSTIKEQIVIAPPVPPPRLTSLIPTTITDFFTRKRKRMHSPVWEEDEEWYGIVEEPIIGGLIGGETGHDRAPGTTRGMVKMNKSPRCGDTGTSQGGDLIPGVTAEEVICYESSSGGDIETGQDDEVKTGPGGNYDATTGGVNNDYEISQGSAYGDGQTGHHTTEPEPGWMEGDGGQTNLWWDDDEDVFLASQSELLDIEGVDGQVNQSKDGLECKDDNLEKEDDQIKILRGEDGQKGTRFNLEEWSPPLNNRDLDQPYRKPQPDQPPIIGWGQDGPGVVKDRGEISHPESPQHKIVLEGTTMKLEYELGNNRFMGEATFADNTLGAGGEDTGGDRVEDNEGMVPMAGVRQDTHGDKVICGHKKRISSCSTPLMTEPSSEQQQQLPQDSTSDGGEKLGAIRKRILSDITTPRGDGVSPRVKEDTPSQEGIKYKEVTLDIVQSPVDLGRRCVHTKDGVCSLHGEGAKRLPKLVTQVLKDKTGQEVRKTVKKYFFVCDLSMRRGNKLRQTRLSFKKTTKLEDNQD